MACHHMASDGIGRLFQDLFILMQGQLAGPSWLSPNAVSHYVCKKFLTGEVHLLQQPKLFASGLGAFAA